MGLRVLLQQVRAGNIRGHQVRGELYTVEAEVQNVRQGAHQKSLGEPRHANQQAMPLRKKGDQQFFDNGVLADDDLFDLLQNEQPLPGNLGNSLYLLGIAVVADRRHCLPSHAFIFHL